MKTMLPDKRHENSKILAGQFSDPGGFANFPPKFAEKVTQNIGINALIVKHF